MKVIWCYRISSTISRKVEAKAKGAIAIIRRILDIPYEGLSPQGVEDVGETEKKLAESKTHIDKAKER